MATGIRKIKHLDLNINLFLFSKKNNSTIFLSINSWLWYAKELYEFI